MKTTSRRIASPLERPRVPWRGAARAARIIHPFPTLLNVAAVAALSFVAADGAPPASVLVRMLAVMFCAQAAIGALNDLFDRQLDAATKRWKPLVAGVISPGAARALAVALIVAMLALAATLGAGGFLLAIAGAACGVAYDVRLKRSTFSAAPFALAVPLLPMWVWAALGEWEGVLWWLLPLGALIGVALHLANTVPDIADDTAHGVRGMAHALGARRSTVAAWASFGAALALSLVIAPVAGYDWRIYAPTLVAGIVVLVAVAALSARRNAGIAFPLLGVGAIALAAGWLAAAT